MVYFREVQRFRQPWLWLLLMVPMGLTAWRIYRRLGLHQPLDAYPLTDAALMAPLLAILLVVLWISQLTLVTEVRDEEIDLRFRLLFSHRKIPIREVQSCEAVRYEPIQDYGGWGLRISSKGRAYNVSGDRGVQLELRDGERILIGSQQPVPLAHAISGRMAALSGE